MNFECEGREVDIEASTLRCVPLTGIVYKINNIPKAAFVQM